MNTEQFIEYCLDFYGKNGIYDYGFTVEEIELATRLYQLGCERSGEKFCGDTIDRERVRDIILAANDMEEV